MASAVDIDGHLGAERAFASLAAETGGHLPGMRDLNGAI